MKKNILIVSQYFYPESFRINDIAQELVKKDYKVTVLTGIPNYPEGKFFKGYGWHKNRKEIWNNIEIIRIPILSRGKSKIKLILNYYSFVVSGTFWSLFTKRKFDLVFSFVTSPIIQASVAKRISKRLHIPHYFYVQDVWPDALEAVAGIKNKFVLNHYSKVCKKIYDNARTIFVTSPSFKKTIEERTKTNVIYLPQYAEDCYKVVDKKEINEIPNNNKFKIIFTGNIGKAQGLDILIEVAKQVKDVTFVIVGNGRYKDQFIKNIREVKDQFIIIDRKPKDEIPYLLKSCDVAFISLANNKIFNQSIPAKLQSYLACGMPIIASANGECKRIIEEANCGFCSDANDVNGLIKNINKIRHTNLLTKSQNALYYSKKYFEKNDIINLLIKELEK